MSGPKSTDKQELVMSTKTRATCKDYQTILDIMSRGRSRLFDLKITNNYLINFVLEHNWVLSFICKFLPDQCIISLGSDVRFFQFMWLGLIKPAVDNHDYNDQLY